MNPYMLSFNMLNFILMQTFVLGSMHTALAYKAQWLKMQKLAYWEQNSNHLQDICNAVSTKYRPK